MRLIKWYRGLFNKDKNYKRWTDHEVNALFFMRYHHHKWSSIAKKLKRTKEAVKRKYYNVVNDGN